MTDVIQNCIQSCQNKKRTLALPEGEDPRIQAAALQMKQQQIATPVLFGDQKTISKVAAESGHDLSDIQIIDMSAPVPEHLSQTLVGKKKKITADNVDEFNRQPVYRAVAMLHSGDVDAMVAGAVLSTANVMAAAFAVGPKPGIETLSSFFIMSLQKDIIGDMPDTLLFADCALNIAPTEDQLAEIAISSAESAAKLLGTEPRVAMLSFSTHGSARHAHVSKVASAVEKIKARAPTLMVDGDIQADAALSARVAATKLGAGNAGHDVAGKANVLVFPDLNSGNIAYKLVQYCGGAQAIGPILQGFAKPVCDLSRGASVEDIVAAAAVTLTLSDDT